MNSIKLTKNETLKTIEDYPNYKISSKGRVYSVKSKKFLKFLPVYSRKTDNQNYNSVVIFNENGSKQVYVHRLVAQAFLGMDISNPKIHVHHIDGKKSNNNLENITFMSEFDHMSMHCNTCKTAKENINKLTDLIVEMDENLKNLKTINETFADVTLDEYLSFKANKKLLY